MAQVILSEKLKIYATVDESVLYLLSPYYWRCTNAGRKHRYAYAKINGHRVYMHRLIAKPPVGKFVDHINHDTLDNRAVNLRVCTHKENMANRLPSIPRSTGSTGVAKHRDGYMAYAHDNGKQVYLGKFATKEQAQKARLTHDKTLV